MGTLTHRRYRTAAPAAVADPNFGPAASTPDPFALTTELFIRFGMRVTSFAQGTAHQWGQWGAIDNQQSWGYSFHVGGFPRLAIYPTGLNASLIGPQTTQSYADVLGPITLPAWLWVAVYVELNVGGGRRWTYWCSRTGFGALQVMDGGPITDGGGPTTFFNSTAVFTCPGYVGPSCDRYVDIEVRERPGGPLLVDPRVQHQQPYLIGSFSGGPDTWVGPDGRTYTLGAFGDLLRSPVPRPYAA